MRGVLTSSPLADKKDRTRRPEVVSRIKETFRNILEIYDGFRKGLSDPDYCAWHEFAEQHESNGDRLRRFVASLRGRKKLDRKQRDYLSDLSTFLTDNLPYMTSGDYSLVA